MTDSYYEADGITLHLGDIREVLASLPTESVNTVVTSPPFWSLRKYDVPPSVWGGSPDCDHRMEATLASDALVISRHGLDGSTLQGGRDAWGDRGVQDGYQGRQRWQHDGVSRQETPEAWVKQGKITFTPQSDHNPDTRGQESWRAGTAGEASLGATCARCGAWRGWLGLEQVCDCCGWMRGENCGRCFLCHTLEWLRAVRRVMRKDATLWLDIDDSRGGGSGIPAKNLMLIPQRIALACQMDGWILRSEIIITSWMPESVRDRPTDACRKILMLCKTGKYYYDAQAVRVAQSSPYSGRGQRTYGQADISDGDFQGRGRVVVFTDGKDRHGNADDMRNLGTVWEDLPPASSALPGQHFATYPVEEAERCLKAGCPPGGVALDPFIGSGTTAIAARKLGMRCVGIDASEPYLSQAVRRLTVGDSAMRRLHEARQNCAEQAVLWETGG